MCPHVAPDERGFRRTQSETKRPCTEGKIKKPGRLQNHAGLSVVPGVGLEPTRCLAPADFESAASTNFATPAAIWKTEIMAQWEPQFLKNRTT